MATASETLQQELLNQYLTENVKVSFVLFDEIEEASDALAQLRCVFGLFSRLRS